MKSVEPIYFYTKRKSDNKIVSKNTEEWKARLSCNFDLEYVTSVK